MSWKRSAVATVLLAIAGIAICALIISVHRQIESADGYAGSFCNVNADVNCEEVLASEYARWLGVPVAWWGVVTYAAFLAGAVYVSRASRASARRRAALALLALSTWSVLFSLYLALASILVIESLCLMCSGLYIVNAGLFVSCWMLFTATRAVGRRDPAERARERRRDLAVAGVVGALVVVLVGKVLWEMLGPEPELMPPELIRTVNPGFVEWYQSLPVKDVDLPARHMRGSADGVRIVEFSDFQCGHCARAHRMLEQALARYGDELQVSFHHFPLDGSCNPEVQGSFHAYACLAAMAAECAGEQGKFWSFHDRLFENQKQLDREKILGFAAELGLDGERFDACLAGDAARQAVRRDVQEARRLEITSTPTFFFNGRQYRGAPDLEKLLYAVSIERSARPGK